MSALFLALSNWVVLSGHCRFSCSFSLHGSLVVFHFLAFGLKEGLKENKKTKKQNDNHDSPPGNYLPHIFVCFDDVWFSHGGMTL